LPIDLLLKFFYARKKQTFKESDFRMKKNLIFILLLFIVIITAIGSENFITKEHEFVTWKIPDDWPLYDKQFMPGTVFFKGELGSENEISQGAIFAVVTQKGFALNMISEMSNDASTEVQIHAKNYLNGMERDYYEGIIDNQGKRIWFTLSYFPPSDDYDEFMVFGLATGTNMYKDRAMLNHIIASVDIIPEKRPIDDTEVDSAQITLLNSENAEYRPEALIEFEYQVKENILQTSPWIGIIPSDVAHGDESENDKHDLNFIYINENNGKLSLKAPLEEGMFDIRLHDTDFNGRELAFVSFEVKKPVESLPVITMNKKIFYPGEEIQVTFKNAPANTTRDWIGIYRENSENTDYLSWQYLNGLSDGEISFIGPSEIGNYQIKMFDNDSYQTIAVSETLQIVEEIATDISLEREKLFISHYEFCSKIKDGKAVDSKLRFSKNDEKIYILITIEEYQKAHQLSWEWIKPTGEVFDQIITLNLDSAMDLGYKTIRNYNVWSWLNTSALDDSLKGIWKINFYVDEEVVLTRQFLFY